MAEPDHPTLSVVQSVRRLHHLITRQAQLTQALAETLYALAAALDALPPAPTPQAPLTLTYGPQELN